MKTVEECTSKLSPALIPQEFARQLRQEEESAAAGARHTSVSQHQPRYASAYVCVCVCACACACVCACVCACAVCLCLLPRIAMPSRGASSSSYTACIQQRKQEYQPNPTAEAAALSTIQ